jgi:glycosyltransferase involved in cell wall biosynthesis
MRVLYVSHTGLVSGAEHALLDLLAVLPGQVSPTVACPPGPLADAVRAIGVGVIELPPVSGGFRLHPAQTPRTVAELLVAARALRRNLDAIGADVVHANSLRAGLVVSCALTARRAPVVLHSHDALPTTGSARLVRMALRPVPDAIIAISEFAARAFAGDRFGGRVHVLYNPLDTDRFDPAVQSRQAARARLGLQADAQLLGLVAQITPWKGHEVAIRTLARLHDRFPDLRLLIVGEAKFTSRATRFDNLSYLDSLRQLVSELGLHHRVEFWGERNDVETIFRALDVALSPSWEEPFGRSVIEAMAVGTPVIATDVGGPPEFLDDGVDGFLLPPHEVPRWAETVAGLLDGSMDREKIGYRGSEKVRALFNREIYARKVLRVYENAVLDSPISRARRPLRPSSGGGAEPPSPLQRTGLRILFVEHSSITSGGQHSLLELMQVLKSEHDLQLVCPPGPLAETMRARGFPVHLVPDSQLTFKLSALGTPRELMRAWVARRGVRRHIARLRPDIVHANSVRAGLLTLGLRRDRVVVHCRDLLPPGPAGDAVGRAVMSGSAEVVAVSQAAALRLAGPQWAQRSVSVVDNPVDGERFDPNRWPSDAARKALGVAGRPVLGLIAQITPWKGHTRAVRVLARLRESHPDAQLLMAGEVKFVTRSTRFDNQAYGRELMSLVAELGLSDAVHFLGERDDVDRVMASLDVLLVPSTEEPFGRTVIEAMAMGVPVIATDAGGPGEILRPGYDGIALPPDDIDAWARAAATLARRGRELESRTYALERFSPSRHAAAIVSVYDRIRANGRISAENESVLDRVGFP